MSINQQQFQTNDFQESLSMLSTDNYIKNQNQIVSIENQISESIVEDQTNIQSTTTPFKVGNQAEQQLQTTKQNQLLEIENDTNNYENMNQSHLVDNQEIVNQTKKNEQQDSQALTSSQKIKNQQAQYIENQSSQKKVLNVENSKSESNFQSCLSFSSFKKEEQQYSNNSSLYKSNYKRFNPITHELIEYSDTKSCSLENQQQVLYDNIQQSTYNIITNNFKDNIIIDVKKEEKNEEINMLTEIEQENILESEPLNQNNNSQNSLQKKKQSQEKQQIFDENNQQKIQKLDIIQQEEDQKNPLNSSIVEVTEVTTPEILNKQSETVEGTEVKVLEMLNKKSENVEVTEVIEQEMLNCKHETIEVTEPKLSEILIRKPETIEVVEPTVPEMLNRKPETYMQRKLRLYNEEILKAFSDCPTLAFLEKKKKENVALNSNQNKQKIIKNQQQQQIESIDDDIKQIEMQSTQNKKIKSNNNASITPNKKIQINDENQENKVPAYQQKQSITPISSRKMKVLQQSELMNPNLPQNQQLQQQQQSLKSQILKVQQKQNSENFGDFLANCKKKQSRIELEKQRFLEQQEMIKKNQLSQLQKDSKNLILKFE